MIDGPTRLELDELHAMPEGDDEAWRDLLDADPPLTPPHKLNGHVRVDDRPEVKLGKDLHRVLEECSEALTRDPLVYQRSHRLVTVVGAPAGESVAKGTPIIRELTPPALLPRMTRYVKLLAHKAPDKKAIRLAEMGGPAAQAEWVEAMPPANVVTSLLATAGWPTIPRISGLSVTPIFRADGTICQQPGYDPATELLFAPSAEYPEIQESPTIEDARGALAALREVCCDFPFAAPHHESAWLAGVLTALARAAIDGPVPLFAVDATTRGTGKSRLVDAAMLLVHGESASRMPLPEDDDEMRKRITALLSEGVTGVLLDNITRTIALPSLDAVLTADVWSDRLLGSSSSVRVPARAVWWATGNNIQFGGDLSRRTLHIRLESSLENPEERSDFRHPDLLGWLRGERRRLVTCGLTILRAAAVAGVIPKREKLWGSYESWSSVVPPVLAWLGMPDPCLARATQAAEADPEFLALRILMHGFRNYLDEVGRNSVGTRELLGHIYSDEGSPDMREAVEALSRTQTGKQPTAVQMAGVFRRARGRVIDRMRIVMAHLDSHSKSTQWTVECLEAPDVARAGQPHASAKAGEDEDAL